MKTVKKQLITWEAMDYVPNESFEKINENVISNEEDIKANVHQILRNEL